MATAFMVLGFKLWNCQGLGCGGQGLGACLLLELSQNWEVPFKKKVPLQRVIRVPIAKVKYHTGVHTRVHKRNTIYRRLHCVYPNIDGPHYSTVPTVGFRLQYGPLPGPKKIGERIAQNL